MKRLQNKLLEVWVSLVCKKFYNVPSLSNTYLRPKTTTSWKKFIL